MVKHYILLSSSYEDGARIAIDITDPQKISEERVAEVLEKVNEVCGRKVPLSTHSLQTESSDWDSVIAYDPFFEGVICLKSVEKFAQKIKHGQTLFGLDVAKYILSKVESCTHLALEKLVYFAYADYLCSTGKKLFTDKIYAFQFGPVVQSVFAKYRLSGCRVLAREEDDDAFDLVHVEDDEESLSDLAKVMSSRSRILFAADGSEKLLSIDATLEKYKSKTARELVALTHKEGSPWATTYTGELYREIPDFAIEERHYLESL